MWSTDCDIKDRPFKSPKLFHYGIELVLQWLNLYTTPSHKSKRKEYSAHT